MIEREVFLAFGSLACGNLLAVVGNLLVDGVALLAAGSGFGRASCRGADLLLLFGIESLSSSYWRFQFCR